MPTSPNYLLPALLLNPVLVLHSLNTLFSHRFPPPLTPSTSPNAWLEKLGPLPGSTPYFDVHDSEGLCWTYTLILVVAQVLAFSRIQGSRVRRKARLRRGGREVGYSRWSEPEENKDVEKEVVRREKKRENEDMEERRGKVVNGDVHLVDAVPYNLRSRRQIRSISSNRNGSVKKVEVNGYSKDGSVEFAEELKDIIHRRTRDDEDNLLTEDEEEEDDDSVETETSEEIMII